MDRRRAIARAGGGGDHAMARPPGAFEARLRGGLPPHDFWRRTAVNPLRRGACPSIAEPVSTGDGLLMRLVPAATIPLDAFIALCDASRTHGNGIVEVTQRGSLQIRGLSPTTAPTFARTVTGLGLGAVGGPPILTSPLLGLYSREHVDLHALVAALRTELTIHAHIASISPKVSVLIDGGGTLHLGDLAAGLRLRASSC